MEYDVVYKMDVKGKTVLVRFDFNVTLEDGKANPKDKRLVGAKPTIDYILGNGGKLVMMSHLGRPDGKVVEKFRIDPVAKALEQLLGRKVPVAPDCVGGKVESMVQRLKPGDALLLQNLRFHAEEENNDPAFSRQLANLADIYIDDAFGTAHRAHASTAGVVEILKQEGKPVGIGYLVEQELKTFGPLVRADESARRDTVIIIGGAKLKEKMLGATELPGVYGTVIVGGMPYNVFQKSRGLDIGSSRAVEKDGKDYTGKAAKALEKYDNIVLPEEVIIAKAAEIGKPHNFTKFKKMRITEGVPEGYSVVGVIPDEDTLSRVRQARYIINFGTLGIVEQGITKGDLMVAAALKENDNSPFILYCGGDAAKLPNKLGLESLDPSISTGGGSAMEFVIYRDLPALKVLRK